MCPPPWNQQEGVCWAGSRGRLGVFGLVDCPRLLRGSGDQTDRERDWERKERQDETEM